ncbi:MAG: hypothetical protein GF334_06315 [Candidatus Altiarchaeales archaeon]|nr:hypothetical protein [Candidatus Altiarchaeales archaeon]
MARVVKSMDPHEIQKRFSTERYSFFTLDESSFCFEDFEPFMSRLPERERDLLEMYYRGHKKQKDIAAFFDVTQGAISHRIKRARMRLAFLRDMPKLDKDLRDILKGYFDNFDIDVIAYMVETTCQSRTAEILNKKYKLDGRKRMTQVKVRHKFDRSIQKIEHLKKQNTELKVCFELMQYIKDNLYMLHEVVLRHFYRGHHAKYENVY